MAELQAIRYLCKDPLYGTRFMMELQHRTDHAYGGQYT